MPILLSTSREGHAYLYQKWMDKLPTPSDDEFLEYQDVVLGKVPLANGFPHENERDISMFESRYLLWLVMREHLPMNRLTQTFSTRNDTRANVLAEFISKPGKRTAKRVLDAFDIPVPLEGMLKSGKVGGLRQKGGVASEMTDMTKRFEFSKAIMNLDALHDLRGSRSGNLIPTVHELLKNLYFIPNDVKTTISTPGNTWNATYYSLPFLFAEFKKMNLTLTHETLSKGTLDATQDGCLWKLWQNWRQKDHLHIVMDGICTEQEINETEKIYLQAAFVLMLFSNAIKIESQHRRTELEPKTSRLKDVTFLDGTFMAIESMCIPHFLSRFLQVIKDISKIDGDVFIADVSDEYEPELFKIYLGIDDIKIAGDRMELDGRLLPFRLPMSKHKFKQELCKDMPDRAREDLIIMNFLKDAIKCEIAINRNAAYITNDKLAFSWYCLICHWNITKRNGFCFAPHDDRTDFMT